MWTLKCPIPLVNAVHSGRLQCSCKALISNYGFGRFSIFHYDYKRNQTSVREIRKFHLSTRPVQDQMVWQADVFEMRTK